MTNANDLAALHQITRARYEQRRQSFAKLVAEETALRAELARLDGMNHIPSSSQGAPAQMHSIGADVLWRGWLGRTKTALNMRLARVLAVKEGHLMEVRRAYGKVLVIEELQQNLSDKTRKTRQDAQLAQAIDATLQGSRRG